MSDNRTNYFHKSGTLCVYLGKASKEMTEEMILKKTEKNRKRRLAAQRRKERRKVWRLERSISVALCCVRSLSL